MSRPKFARETENRCVARKAELQAQEAAWTVAHRLATHSAVRHRLADCAGKGEQGGKSQRRCKKAGVQAEARALGATSDQVKDTRAFDSRGATGLALRGVSPSTTALRAKRVARVTKSREARA